MRLSAQDVYCEKCRALPGLPCTRPNRNSMHGFHQARWDALGRARWSVRIGHLDVSVTAVPGKVVIGGLWLAVGDDELEMTVAEADEFASAIAQATVEANKPRAPKE